MKKIIKEQLKKIKDLDSLNEMKEYIDSEIKTREQVISLCNEANELKESKNFGFVKESMEAISTNLFKTKSGRDVIKKYVNEIRSNKTLSSLHSLFEGLRKIKNADLAQDLIKEWAENNKFNAKEYRSGMKNLGNIIAEGFIMSEMPIESVINEETSLYNTAVMSIVESCGSKKKDLGSYFNNINIITEQISNRKNESHEELEEAIRNFDKKFSGKLNADEENTIKEWSITEDKEASYNKEKQNCLDKLEEAKTKLEKEGDFETCGRIELFIEGVESKSYKEETATEDVVNFIELSKCFL